MQIYKNIILSAAIMSALTTSAQTQLYPNEFKLSDVKLLESPFYMRKN